MCKIDKVLLQYYKSERMFKILYRNDDDYETAVVKYKEYEQNSSEIKNKYLIKIII